MGTAVGIAVIIGFIAAHVAYGNWLTKGIKPRSFDTSMSPEQLRAIFIDKVGRAGWKIVDDGNPIVAQSSLATGIRQQISLTTKHSNGRTVVRVGPQRWVTKWGVPKKAHTIRIRLNSFVEAVQAHDAAIDVRVQDLVAK
jgi:hypothetical protein